MSVLSCDRKDCNEILCSILVDGCYVCHDCVDEFTRKFGDQQRPKNEILEAFRNFMQTPKNEIGYNDLLTTTEFFYGNRIEI